MTTLIDDELTAVSRRPQRSIMWLAIFAGCACVLGPGMAWFFYDRASRDLSAEVTALRSELNIERESNEAERHADVTYHMVTSDRIEQLEHDNNECRSLTSLP